MSKFQILCVTMFQTNFSKINEMNIHSDVIFANQANSTSYTEHTNNGSTSIIITTNTRGVGINRNIALMYATGDICLFADDDIVYHDDYQKIVLNAFCEHPKADMILFNVQSTDEVRKIAQIRKDHWFHFWSRNPFGGPRIAVRLSSVRKKNLWFTTLFGGGCIFPSGEDSLFIESARKAGFRIYCKASEIGTVKFEKTTWFNGYDESFYYGKGAFYRALNPIIWPIRMYCFVIRTNNMGKLTIREKIKFMKKGVKGFDEMKAYTYEK